MTGHPSFDAGLAARGKQIHALLLHEADVHEFYLSGSLFAEGTSETKASISVPLAGWRALGDQDRSALMHYAASLVESMRANPHGYGHVTANAPAADLVRANVGRMGTRSWVIHGGRLERKARRGRFDILLEEAVASGDEHSLEV